MKRLNRSLIAWTLLIVAAAGVGYYAAVVWDHHQRAAQCAHDADPGVHLAWCT